MATTSSETLKAAIGHDPDLTVIYGPPGRGKTQLAKAAVREAYAQRRIAYAAIFTPNTDEWLDAVPRAHASLVRRNYSPGRLARILRTQRDASPNEDKRPRAVVILDDMLGIIDFASRLVAHCMTTYRHYRLSIWILVQNVSRYIPPLLRDCASRAIIFQPQTAGSYRILYEAFGMRAWGSQKEFTAHVSSETRKRNCHAFVVVDLVRGVFVTSALIMPERIDRGDGNRGDQLMGLPTTKPAVARRATGGATSSPSPQPPS